MGIIFHSVLTRFLATISVLENYPRQVLIYLLYWTASGPFPHLVVFALRYLLSEIICQIFLNIQIRWCHLFKMSSARRGFPYNRPFRPASMSFGLTRCEWRRLKLMKLYRIVKLLPRNTIMIVITNAVRWIEKYSVDRKIFSKHVIFRALMSIFDYCTHKIAEYRLSPEEVLNYANCIRIIVERWSFIFSYAWPEIW